MADLDFLVQICEAATDTDILVLDIENPREKNGTAPIVCVGFSLTSNLSLTIPTTKSYWGKQLDAVLETIRYICGLPVHKGAWNNFHEQYWMWNEREIVIGCRSSVLSNRYTSMAMTFSRSLLSSPSFSWMPIPYSPS